MLQVMWQVNDNLWNSFCWKLILKFIIIYYSFLLIYNNYRLTLMYSSVNASLRQPHSFPPSLRHTTIRGYAPTVKAECVVVVGVDLYRYCPTKTTSNRFACYFRCPFFYCQIRLVLHISRSRPSTTGRWSSSILSLCTLFHL